MLFSKRLRLFLLLSLAPLALLGQETSAGRIPDEDFYLSEKAFPGPEGRH